MAHGAALDVLEDVAQVFEDEVVGFLPTPLSNLAEQLGRLQKVAKAFDGFFLDRRKHFIPVLRFLLDLIEGDPVVLENLIGEQMHPLGEVLVENEAEDVIAKFIRAHLTP